MLVCNYCCISSTLGDFSALFWKPFSLEIWATPKANNKDTNSEYSVQNSAIVKLVCDEAVKPGVACGL